MNEEQQQMGNLGQKPAETPTAHSLCSAGTPADYVVVFIHYNLMETRYLVCATAHPKALRPK